MSARLPADDPRPLRRKARLQRRREQFTYDYEHVTPLALAHEVPDSHAPAWAWWELVLERADTILDNIRVIRRGKHGPGDSDGVERRARGIRQIRDEVSSGRVRESRRLDGADDDDDSAGDKRARLGARMGALFESPWQKVLSDLSDKAAEGAIHGRATSLRDFEALFDKVPFAGESQGILDDEEFAWLRLAGPNPTVIRRAIALPVGFAVTDAHLRAAARDPADSLAAALADGRLYLCDYTDLASMKPGTFPIPKVVAGPLALFVVEREGQRRLLPVAIQNQALGRVFGPADGWAWQMSKLVVQAADGNHHEAVAHLGRTHLFVEPFVIATERQLDQHHPIYRLLRPHFEGTLFINNSAHAALIAPGGTVDRLMSGTIQSSRAAAAAGLHAIPFNASMLNDELKNRQVRDTRALPVYPYRDDALLHWDALMCWVRDYLRLYYADDDAVQRDDELQAWAAELVSRNGGRVMGFGEPEGKIRTRDYLVRALTLVIFTASVQHAAVNFPQYGVMSNAANYPLGLYAQPPRGPATEADYLAMLPPLDQALVQLDLGYLLGNLHYTKLGQYEDDWFGDARVAPLMKEYRAALRKIEETIEARNKTRRKRYPYLHPDRVPQSINI